MAKAEIVTVVQEHSIVPQNYWYFYAIGKFESYLMDMREDSLKECINLFEEEQRHLQQLQHLNAILA